MRFFGAAAVCILLLTLSNPLGATVTIYKKDNTWVEGEKLKTEVIFGETYHLLETSGKVIRVKADEVFKIVKEESEDTDVRVRLHLKRGLEAKKNGFLSNALRELRKVLKIDPDNVMAKNNLVIVEHEIGIDKIRRQKKEHEISRGNKELTPDEIQEVIGLRDDQMAFLKMVSEAHKIDYRRLISQAIDNWVKDYKDYKISPTGKENLPPLRYPLVPEK